MCECLFFFFPFLFCLLYRVTRRAWFFENSILLGVSRFILGFPLWDGMSFQLPFSLFLFLFFFGWLAGGGTRRESWDKRKSLHSTYQIFRSDRISSMYVIRKGGGVGGCSK